MRHAIRLPILALALLVVPGLPLAARPQADTIKVDLKTVKFNVPEDKANLFNYDEGGQRLSFYTNGKAEFTVKVPADGEYDIVVRAACDPALNERAKFKVAVDGEPVGKETLLTADDEKDYTLTGKLKAGERTLVVEFTNDVYKEGEYDRNLYVHGVSLKPKK
jgi:hypothetical protein